MRQHPDRREERAPSLLAAVFGHLDKHSRTAEKRRFNLEVGLGLLGFFSLVSVISTLVAELRGEDALRPALLSIAFLGASALVYRAWKRAGGWGS
jgi:hypothetical protein